MLCEGAAAARTLRWTASAVPDLRSISRKRKCIAHMALMKTGTRQAMQEEQQGGKVAVTNRLTNKHSQAVDVAAGYSPLILVSLLWGSYAPVLRYLYSMDDSLTPQMLTAHRTVISAVALVSASAASIASHAYRQHTLRAQQQRQCDEQPSMRSGRGGSSSSSGSGKKTQRSNSSRWLPGARAATEDAASSFSAIGSSSGTATAAAPGAATAATRLDTSTAAAVLIAGLELGVWNFLGTSAQAVGLELSTATKAAFLTQTTAVFTPCFAALSGQQVLLPHWLACLAALVGSCCITLDSYTDTWQQQQQQAQEPAAVALNSSSSSSSKYDFADAAQLPPPLLQQQQQPQQGMLTAPSISNEDVADAASIPNSMKVINSNSTSARQQQVDGAGQGPVLLPAASCRPPTHPPQGAVPSLVCAPVPAAAASSTHSTDRSNDRSSESTPGSSVVNAAASGSPSADPPGTPLSSPMADVLVNQQQQALSSQQPVPRLSAAAAGVGPAAAASSGGSSSNINSINNIIDSGSGELYILVACGCYAIATVRMSSLAPGLDPVQFATSKTLTLAAASLCWLLAYGTGGSVTNVSVIPSDTQIPAAAVGAAEGLLSLQVAVADAVQHAAEAWQLPSSFTHGKGMLLLLYSALGPGALATVLQARGQAVVTAAQAQVLFSLTPVWSAVLAGVCLQGEEMGPLAWLGAAIIIAASIGAAVSDSSGADSSSSSSSSSSNSSSMQKR